MLKNFLFFLLSFVPNLYRVCKVIKSEKIDIIHVNGLLNIIPVLGGVINKMPVVWHLNDMLTPRPIVRCFLPLLRWLPNRIVVAARKVADFHFVNNTELWNKTIVLYAPVDTELLDPNKIRKEHVRVLKEDLNIHPDDFVVGAIGNINKAKGFEYFVETAGILKKNLENVKFLIAGGRLNTKQEYWDRLHALVISLDLTDDIHFLGYRKDIFEILSIFDVLVLSSITEACPMVVLEAMAMMVPVVATDVGGVREQIEDRISGIVVQSKRSDLLADGVMEISRLPEEELENMTSASRKRVEQLFSLDRIAEQHKNIYDELISCASANNSKNGKVLF